MPAAPGRRSGTVADTAGGYAALTQLPAGSDVVTLKYKVNFLRPAAGDRLVAEGGPCSGPGAR